MSKVERLMTIVDLEALPDDDNRYELEVRTFQLCDRVLVENATLVANAILTSRVMKGLRVTVDSLFADLV